MAVGGGYFGGYGHSSDAGVGVYMNASAPGDVKFGDGVFDIFSSERGVGINSLAVGDIDLDGRPDLVVGYMVDPGRFRDYQAGVYVIANRTEPGASSFAWNHTRYVVASYERGGIGRQPWHSLGPGATNPFSTTHANPAYAAGVMIGDMATSVAVGDIDLDGRPEIVVANPYNKRVDVFFNDTGPGGDWKSAGEQPILFDTPVYSVALADMNLDGSLDLILNGQQTSINWDAVVQLISDVGGLMVDVAGLVTGGKSVAGAITSLFPTSGANPTGSSGGLTPPEIADRQRALTDLSGPLIQARDARQAVSARLADLGRAARGPGKDRAEARAALARASTYLSSRLATLRRMVNEAAVNPTYLPEERKRFLAGKATLAGAAADRLKVAVHDAIARDPKGETADTPADLAAWRGEAAAILDALEAMAGVVTAATQAANTNQLSNPSGFMQAAGGFFKNVGAVGKSAQGIAESIRKLTTTTSGTLILSPDSAGRAITFAKTYLSSVSTNSGDAVQYGLAAYLTGDGVPDLIQVNSGDRSSISYSVNKTGASVTARMIKNRGVVFDPTRYNDPALGAELTAKGRPRAGVVGDFNGDGRVDLIVGSATDDRSVGYLTLFRNTTPPRTYPTTPTFVADRVDVPIGSVVDLATLDVNGDGMLDLAAVTSNDKLVLVTFVTPARNGGRAPVATTIDLDAKPTEIRVADLDGDGMPDLLIGTDDGPREFLNRTARGTGAAPTFKKAPLPAELGLPTGLTSAVAVDLDNDGRADLAMIDHASGKIAVYRNLTARGSNDLKFRLNQHLDVSGQFAPTRIVAASLTNDGRMDLAVLNGGGSVSLYFNNTSTGSLDPSIRLDRAQALPVPAGSTSIQLADLDRNGTIDLLTTSRLHPAATLFLGVGGANNNEGLLLSSSINGGANLSFPTGLAPSGTVVADFNLDGRPDFAVLTDDPSGSNVFMWTANPAATVTTAPSAPITADPPPSGAPPAGAPPAMTEEFTIDPSAALLMDGVITVYGTPAADVILIREVGGRVEAVLNGRVVARVPRGLVTGRVQVFGGDGNDRVRVTASVPAELFGDDGDDVLMGGPLADVLHGGRGHDTLIGGGGADALHGGYGRDRLFGGPGDDLMIGGQILQADWYIRTGGDLLEYATLSGLAANWSAGAPDARLTADHQPEHGLSDHFADVGSFGDRRQSDFLVGGSGRNWLIGVFQPGPAGSVAEVDHPVGFRRSVDRLNGDGPSLRPARWPRRLAPPSLHGRFPGSPTRPGAR